MINLDILIYIQLLGAILSILSFFVFTSAFRSSKANYTYEEDASYDVPDKEKEPLFNGFTFPLNSFHEFSEKHNTHSLLKSLFTHKAAKKGVEDNKAEKLDVVNEEEILLQNELDDLDFLFEDEDKEIADPVVDENVDEDVYQDFPHEKREVSLFSKELKNDIEISDIKELLSTIKEEFKNDK